MDLDISCDSAIALKHFLKGIFKSRHDKDGAIKARGYVIKDKHTMILIAYKDKEQTYKNYESLPYPIDYSNVNKFVSNWLKSVEVSDRLTENDDGDGSHGAGYRIFTGWQNTHEIADEIGCYDFAIICGITAMNIYYSK